jgi:hypothetical protein
MVGRILLPRESLLMQATLDALAEFPRRLEAHFAAVPPELLRWAPPGWNGVPSERLTPIEQVWHLRDIEIDGYHVRFRRTLQELHPVLPDLDGEALARERRYADRDPVQALREFRAARDENIALLRSLPPPAFERTATFEGIPVTLRTLVHTLCSHDLQHLAGLQWLLGRMSASRAPAPVRAPIRMLPTT